MAISITQATEIGALYQPDEIAAIADCPSLAFPLHMDGTRLRYTGCIEPTRAEMTWKRGVDIVSFSATKTVAGVPKPWLLSASRIGQRFTVYP